MKITLEIPNYNPYEGMRLNWEPGFMISVKVNEGGSISIEANREGLISLARHFLNLSNPEIPSGNHIHLDQSNSFGEGSYELIIIKK